MYRTREILRQKWALGRTHREVAASVGTSAGAIGNVLARAAAAGVKTLEQAESLSDDELEARLYGKTQMAPTRAEPDCAWVHRERHRPGVTLELLHQEYLAANPGGYQYTAFCDRYREWLGKRGLVMRQTHVAGDKMYVDYAGMKGRLIDPSTGESVEVELFVAVLGASNYTYAEVTRTQRGRDWIASHVRTYEYFGGVPRGTVCDQLKSGIIRSCRYEPEVQRTYEELARHYGTTVMAARPRKPRDKAKVEVAVQIAERWILARLRNEVFHTLAAMNARIRELLVLLNDRKMNRYGKSRRELFDEIERGALGPLPEARFEYADWKRARVSIDYHVVFEHHYYSVPYALVHEEVVVRAAGGSIEVLHRGQRVAAHPRSSVRGAHTTTLEHMPSTHRAQASWTPERIDAWAAKVGANVRDLMASILARHRAPELGFRSCLGILRLEKVYGAQRLDAACARAHRLRALSYRSVASILKHRLDEVALEESTAGRSPIEHENVRGPEYYLN